MSAASEKQRKQYLATQVTTASKEQLVLMLFDGILRFCENAKAAYQAVPVRFEAGGMAVQRAQAIIMELIYTLDREKGGDIAENLARLHAYSFKCLLQASLSRDMAKAQEVITIYTELRSAWIEAMNVLGLAGAAATAAMAKTAALPASAPANPAAPAAAQAAAKPSGYAGALAATRRMPAASAPPAARRPLRPAGRGPGPPAAPGSSPRPRPAPGPLMALPPKPFRPRPVRNPPGALWPYPARRAETRGGLLRWRPAAPWRGARRPRRRG